MPAASATPRRRAAALANAVCGGGHYLYRLGPQLVALVVAAVLVSAGLVAIVAIRQSRGALRAEILENNAAAAELAAEYVDRAVDVAQIGLRGVAGRLSALPSLEANRAAAQRQVSALFQSTPLLDTVSVYDRQGTLVASSLANNPHVDQPGVTTDREWFQHAVATGAPYLGVPTVSRITGQPTVPYAVPILAPDGAVRGVVVGGIAVSRLADAIDLERLGPAPHVSILDVQHEVIVWHVDPARLLQPIAGHNEAVRRLARGERGAIEAAPSSGERTLAAFAPVSRLGWGVLIQEPVESALAPVADLTRDMLGIVGVSTLLVAIAGTLVALLARRPLLRLRDTALAVAAGDLSRRVKLGRRDEIGDLGRAFDRMAGALAAREAALQASERWFRALVEQSHDVTLVLTRDGSYRYISPALPRVLGYTVEERQGRTFMELVHPADQEWVRAQTATILGVPGGTATTELRVRHKDGSWRWLEATATNLTDEPDVAGVVVNYADITARKEAQAALLAMNQQLREALLQLETTQQQVIQQERLRALGEMASGVAHDLNNALAPVAGFAELLLFHSDTFKDEGLQRSYLELIRTGAQDAAGVVRRLREFYRPAGPHDAFAPVDLAHLIEQVVALTQPKWKDQAQGEGRLIAVEVEPAPEPLPPVAGNEAQLREALTNLVFNAVDALPNGGTITLSARQRGPAAALSVHDTGTGMTEEVRRRCLEPFFSTKGERGTGLGLAMVHGIVQRHQGRLEIDSAAGRGTTFTLLLPLTLDDQPREAGVDGGGGNGAERDSAAGDGAGAGRHIRALVVDDEPVVRQITRAYLELDGHTVVDVANGCEAMAQLGRESAEDGPASGSCGGRERAGACAFDVVVTDRAMPGMSGDQLAALVKQRWPATPVILVTGFAALMESTGERPAGVDAILAKPAGRAALRRTLADVLRQAVAIQ